jgi:hypothetical protein
VEITDAHFLSDVWMDVHRRLLVLVSAVAANVLGLLVGAAAGAAGWLL